MCTQLFDNGDQIKNKNKHHKVGTAPKSNRKINTNYHKVGTAPKSNRKINKITTKTPKQRKINTNSEQLQNQIEK